MHQTLLTDQFEFLVHRIHRARWMNVAEKMIFYCATCSPVREDESGMHHSVREKKRNKEKELSPLSCTFLFFIPMLVACKLFWRNNRVTCHPHSLTLSIVCLHPSESRPPEWAQAYLFFTIFSFFFIFSSTRRPFRLALSSVSVCLRERECVCEGALSIHSVDFTRLALSSSRQVCKWVSLCIHSSTWEIQVVRNLSKIKVQVNCTLTQAVKGWERESCKVCCNEWFKKKKKKKKKKKNSCQDQSTVEWRQSANFSSSSSGSFSSSCFSRILFSYSFSWVHFFFVVSTNAAVEDR